MVSAVRKYSFTIDELATMGQAGIFTEDDRVELIDGEIRELPSISPERCRYGESPKRDPL